MKYWLYFDKKNQVFNLELNLPFGRGHCPLTLQRGSTLLKSTYFGDDKSQLTKMIIDHQHNLM